MQFLEIADIKTARTSAPKHLNAGDTGFHWSDLDWSVCFSPFDIVDFYMHKDLVTPGGKLPIRDKAMANANLAGDGLGVVLKPVDGLKIAAEVPFSISYAKQPNFLNAEAEDKKLYRTKDNKTGANPYTDYSASGSSDYKFVLNLGVEYSFAEQRQLPKDGAGKHLHKEISQNPKTSSKKNFSRLRGLCPLRTPKL